MIDEYNPDDEYVEDEYADGFIVLTLEEMEEALGDDDV